MRRIKFIFSLMKESFSAFSDDNALKLSAALSYYTVFSLAPMLLLMISVVSIFFKQEAFQGQLFYQIDGLVGKEAAAQLQELIKNAAVTNKSTVAATIGGITLLIGATGVFAEIQDSINYIWAIKSKPQKSWLQYLKNRFLSFSIILTLGFLLVVSLGVNAVVDLLSARLERYFSEVSVIIFSVLNVALVLVIIAALFAVIFKVLPDAHLRWKECIAGAIFTSLLFAIGKFGISFYLGQSDLGATYGASASIVILLTWVYYSSIILYFGAEFTKVYAKSDGNAITPNEHAVLIVRKEVETKGSEPQVKEDEKTASSKSKPHHVLDVFANFIEEKVDSIRAEIEGTIAKLASPAVFYVWVFVLVFTLLIILILLAGHFLNKSMESDYLGFVILLGLSLALLALAFIYKTNLLETIRKLMIRLRSH